MSVDMDVRVGVSRPATQHFGADGVEVEASAVSRDWLREVKLWAAVALGLVASCALPVLVFLR